MNLTRAAISRPVFILMILIAAILGGTIAYNSMRLEQNPEVNFGTVVVQTTYSGASPEDINELITRPVEDSVSGVNGIRDITSTSQEGSSIVVIQFELNIDPNVALEDVRSKVDAVTRTLPRDVDKPVVTKTDSSSSPVLYLAFSSKTLNSRDLRTLMDDKIADRYAQIPGVSAATVQGGDVREIQVRMKRDRLLQYGVGITDVLNAVSGSSLNAPAGRVVNGPQEYTVRVNAQFANVDDVRNTILRVSDPNQFNAKARILKLGDIADVVDTIQERTSYARMNGRDTIVLAIEKTREGNAVEITTAADEATKKILSDFKDAQLSVTKTLEQAKNITDSLSDLNFTLAFGIFLVGLIVFIFLHDVRGTLIVALAIPSSIFITFVALKLLGFTINNMSMLALSLAVGVLVDDAIVVLENIYRHLKLGEDPREAALNGRAEIGLAALAITFADVVVFTPIAFMGGIVGQFFKPLAVGFVAAVLSSLFISFTLTPLLAARWYRAGEDIEHPKGRFAQLFERGFGRLEHGYRRALEWALNHRWFVFILGNVAILSIVAFIMGGFTAAAPAIGEKVQPGPPQFGVPGAIVKSGIFIVGSLFVGLMVFATNRLRAENNPRRGFIQVAVCIAIGLVLAVPMVWKMGLPWYISPIAGFLATFFIAYVPLILLMLVKHVFRPISPFRYVGKALLFSLIFPFAAVLGYGFGQWKQGPVFKGGFLPDSDAIAVQATIELPPGASLEETQKVVTQVENVFMADSDVKYTLSNVGTQATSAFGASNNGSNYALVQGTLYDREAFLDKMKGIFGGKPEEHVRNRSGDAVAADLTRRVGRIPGASVKVSAQSGFSFGSAVQISLTSDNRELLTQTAIKIRDFLASGVIPGVVNPDLSSKPGKVELQANPDRTALADRGLSVNQYASSVRTLYQGDDTTKLRSGGREYAVRVMLDIADRNDPTNLGRAPIAFSRGEPIFLNSVANIHQAPGYSKITRNARAEQISVTADILPGYANGSVNQQIFSELAKRKLIPEGVNSRPLGQADAQAREMGYLFSALGIGVVLVYMLLASLYDNILYPLIIQLAQPQAMVGALLALVITDKSFNLVGFIGIICLVGLVAKNAILLVDYTNTLRDRGRDRHDALVEAGPTRLRPIMMTTLALILGMLPVALAIGRGSEFRETIGITIIGGIMLSTFLTLLVIPCSYTIFDDLSDLIGKGWKLMNARRHKPA